MELLSRFEGKLVALLDKCIIWIQQGQIVLLGIRGDLNNWIYDDYRDSRDKVSTIATGVIR